MESLHGEIHHLKCIFQRNGYNKDHIRRALHQKQNRKLKDEKHIGIARLPYNKTYCNKISRVLQKFNIRTVHIPWKKTIQTLRSVKDELGLNVPGVYQIPCECDKVYMGQTRRSIETRCTEHRRHIHLSQPDKSVVAKKHSINTRHCIDFTNTIVLDRTLSYMDRLVKEAIGIRLNNKNFNRDGGLMLSRAWHPLINMLTNQEAGLMQQALDT
jgi:hypothetical protein